MSYMKTVYFTVYIKGDIAFVSEVEERLSAIKNHDGASHSPSESIAITFIDGINNRFKEITDNGQNLTGYDKFLNESRQLKKKLEKDMQELSELEDLFHRLGDEGFREHCEKYSMNADKIKADFAALQDTKKWPDRIFDWLCEVLETGDAVETSVIRSAAIKAGLLEASDEYNWARIRVLASRRGLTNHSYGRGLWVLPSKYRPMVYK